MFIKRWPWHRSSPSSYTNRFASGGRRRRTRRRCGRWPARSVLDAATLAKPPRRTARTRQRIFLPPLPALPLGIDGERARQPHRHVIDSRHAGQSHSACASPWMPLRSMSRMPPHLRRTNSRLPFTPLLTPSLIYSQAAETSVSSRPWSLFIGPYERGAAEIRED